MDAISMVGDASWNKMSVGTRTGVSGGGWKERDASNNDRPAEMKREGGVLVAEVSHILWCREAEYLGGWQVKSFDQIE